MRKCPFCKNSIKLHDGNHVYRCNTNATLSKLEIRFLFIQYNFPEISNRNVLENIYVKELNGLPDIRSKYGIDFRAIMFLLEYHNIPKRTASESVLKIAKPRREKTMMERYGVKHNLQKDSPFYEIRNETVRRKYGVNNVFQSKEVKDIIRDKWYNGDTKEKRAKTMLEHYGYVNAFEDRDILVKALRKSFGAGSGLNDKVKNKLKDDDIEFEDEFLIKCNGRMYFYDIKIDNLLVEVNGDFWHANPCRYSSEDYVPLPNCDDVQAKDLWEKDKIKKQIALDSGYNYVVVWETDINKDINSVIEEIKEMLFLG